MGLKATCTQLLLSLSCGHKGFSRSALFCFSHVHVCPLPKEKRKTTHRRNATQFFPDKSFFPAPAGLRYCAWVLPACAAELVQSTHHYQDDPATEDTAH